jgi:hypothetical protein
MNESAQKAQRLQDELVRAAIDLQALGNRLLHLGPAHRAQAKAVRGHAAALAADLRALGRLGNGRTAELFHFFEGAIYRPPQPQGGQTDSEGGDPD